MKKYLIALFSGCSILSAVPALAATPVTIQNAANTDAVTITNHGLNVNVTGGSGETVITQPLGATSTDASGTVTTGTTYQTAIAASSTRKGCLIQNPTTATEVLSVKVGTMAAPFTILAGGTFSCASGSIVVTDAITITAPTTGHAFSAVYQ
jgi:hypothetical protein